MSRTGNTTVLAPVPAIRSVASRKCQREARVGSEAATGAGTAQRFLKLAAGDAAQEKRVPVPDSDAACRDGDLPKPATAGSLRQKAAHRPPSIVEPRSAFSRDTTAPSRHRSG